MKSFVQAVEIWVPDADGSRLVFQDGLYGDLTAFKEASASMSFALDEGLPGKAWAQRHPIVLKQFEDSYFKRTEAAAAAGLTCGIALPVFAGETVKAVVLFFCGDDEDRVGVIEVWRHEPERGPGIRFFDGYFGIAETFEWNARNVTFMRGFGLPGRVWEAETPVFVPDLGDGARFLRDDDARRVGLNKGLGIPCPGDEPNVWVMLFLSAFGTPIAKRYEIWTLDGPGGSLTFDAGDCAHDPDLAAALAGSTLARGEGAAGKALETGAPVLLHDVATEGGAFEKRAAGAGLKSVLAIPIHDGDSVRSVVTLYL